MKKRPIRHIDNESGLTLVIVMVLSVVALMIMSALIYMAQSSTEISGLQKQYATALDAGMGGVDVAKEFINTRGTASFANGISFNLISSAACYTAKLTNSTGFWPAGCSNTITLNPKDSTTYDMTAQLGNYLVYAKIVDTVKGNSAPSLGLSKTGVVESNTGQVSVPPVPYLYTLKILTQGQNTPERSKLSAVYQY